MRYKNYITIENDNGKVVQEGFDEFLERKEYVVIDIEKYAQIILDAENITSEMDDCDIMAIIEDYLNTDIEPLILNEILETRNCE